MSLVGFTHIANKEMPVITGSHANFVMLFKYDDFNVGTVLDSIDDGGGNLRFSDDDGVTQLPCEVVQFDKIGGNVQVWVLVPSAFTGKVIQIWGDNSGATQPPVADTFGRNATHPYPTYNSYDGVDSAGVVDLNPNSTIQSSAKIGDGFDDNGSFQSASTTNGALNFENASSYTVGGWVNLDSSQNNWVGLFSIAGSTSTGQFSIQRNSGTSELRVYHSNSAVSLGGVFFDIANGNDNLIRIVWSGATVKLYINGALISTSALTLPPMINDSGFTARIAASRGGVGASGVYSHWVLAKDIELPEDYVATEYSNQSSIGSWGVTTPVSGGAGVSGDIDFTITKPVFNASGAATLPQPLAAIDFTVNKPVFSVEGGASLPQPVGVVDFTVSKPIFSVNGSASLPNPQATISFDIAKPVFNVTGSATSPTPSGNIDFTVAKPVFTASGGATLPQPNANISFDVSKPEFSLTGGASVPYPQATIDFDISKPVFNVNGSVTLPQPSGSVSFEISKPIFNVTGSVSGFNVPIGSIIKLEVGSNVIKLPYTSNTIKL